MSQKKLREKLHRRAVREQRKEAKAGSITITSENAPRILAEAIGKLKRPERPPISCPVCYDVGEVTTPAHQEAGQIVGGQTRPCHCRAKVDEKDNDHE